MLSIIPSGYISSKKSREYLNISGNSLRLLANDGKIDFCKPNGKHRYYNIRKFIEENQNIAGGKPTYNQQRNFCYCRVSTRNQIDDLQRQCEFLSSKFPNYTIVRDIGSGLNFRRRGLQTILECAIKGEVSELVVAHKDRLCRFGFELIEWVINKYSNGKIVVLQQASCSPQQELVNDVLSILNVFSARINGLRKYKSEFRSSLCTDQSRNSRKENQNSSIVSN